MKQCRICGAKAKTLFEDGADFFVHNGQSPAFGVDYCSSCELGYSFPSLSPGELAPYYPENFEAYIPKKQFGSFLQKIKYATDLKKLARYLVSGRKALFEVGAGRGEFLYEAKKRGFEVAGLEPGAQGVAFAQSQYGICLEQKLASSMRFEKSYDVVVMRHVLEHLDDFYECLRKIYEEGLAPGGALFLKLPRLDSWEAKFFGKLWRGFDLPRHRVHFTKNGLMKILRKLGFEDIVFCGEVVPSDIEGSIRYYGMHGQIRILKKVAQGFSLLPYPLKLVISQLVGCLLQPLRAGRMIVLARKS